MRFVKHNSKPAAVIAGLIACAVPFLASVAPASATGPRLQVVSFSNSTVEAGGTLEYQIEIGNYSDTATSGAIEVLATLPVGMSAQAAAEKYSFESQFKCSAADGVSPVAGATSIKCVNSTSLTRFGDVFQERLTLIAAVAPSASGTLLTSFEVSGGGSPPAATVDPVHVSATVPGFGLDGFDVPVVDPSGAPYTQAGGHPEQITTEIDLNKMSKPEPSGTGFPVSPPRDFITELPTGLIGNPAAVATCTLQQLVGTGAVFPRLQCASASQVGGIIVRWSQHPAYGPLPLFNLVPPPGVPARFGFNILGVPVILDARLRQDGSYGVSVSSLNTSEGVPLGAVSATFWGQPGAATHDLERACQGQKAPFETGSSCDGDPNASFLRMPTSCNATVPFTQHVDSWEQPGTFDATGAPDLSDPAWKSRSIHLHEPLGYPYPIEEWGAPVGITNCAKVPVKGTLSATPTSIDTETPTGLGVEVSVPNSGLENPASVSSSDIKGVRVALPEGMTVNPSQAEGLGVCSPAQYASTRLSFHPDPGFGCPDDSKIGTVEVHTPLLEETIPGDVYIAQPYNNPFNSLLALYIVLHEPQRGILVKLAGEVETNARTGQITTTFKDLPQVPFADFQFHFREGARAPLVTPQSCGTYTTHAEFHPWSNPAQTLASDSDFEIIHGIGGGPCPSGGLPPFRPGLIAGTLNNRAGSYSPFNVRLFRTDEEQEFTNFSIKLPPGVIGKIAGLGYCSDTAIEAARLRSGAEEITSPSCPASSQVGRTLAGAGVGSVLTYAPGSLYLAGPYHGSAISLVSITAAKVGPFDLGTVVVRFALRVNPETAEIFIDAQGSDPIPHIIDGITTHLRDIRAYTDRPEFVLNPTSCERTSTASTLLGSGLDFASAADDLPVTVSTPFQAADCAALPFKPKLAIHLRGQTRRAGNPKLNAVLTMKPGQANIARAQVTLPRSEFLDNAHIGTVCTRVQFNKGARPGDACPPASVYGSARAESPLVDYPLEGPLFLRSNPEHELPDLVAALHAPQFDINVVGRVDSVKGGGIRTTFESVPDAPVSKFTLTMAGGKKGLLENSTNLCAAKHRAIVKFDGHNGKISDYRPVVKPSCGKGKHHRR